MRSNGILFDIYVKFRQLFASFDVSLNVEYLNELQLECLKKET